MPVQSDNASLIKQRFLGSSSLLDALDAAYNQRAFVLLSLTWVGSVLLIAVLGAMTAYLGMKSVALGGIFGFITAITVFVFTSVGISATGMMLGDGVWGRPQRGMADALLCALFSFHRPIVIFIVMGLVFLLYLIVLTAVLFLCKVPGIGPLLYAIAFPVGAILTGLILFGMLFVGMPLAAPAVWNGLGIKDALAMLLAIGRKNLLATVIMLVLINIMILFVIGFVGTVLFFGATTVLSLSGIVLSVSGGADFVNLFMGSFSGGGGGGYAYALGLGMAILTLVGMNPGVLIGLKGSSIIYREVSRGISNEDVKAAIAQRVDAVKERAQQAREQALASMQQAQQAIKPIEPAVAPVAAQPACPACGAPFTGNDMFCGSCGHKLK